MTEKQKKIVAAWNMFDATIYPGAPEERTEILVTMVCNLCRCDVDDISEALSSFADDIIQAMENMTEGQD